ncbi:peptidylprolyl isomerase [Vibrio rumoiensis]|uniref:peptidylprolyl isomerase n=1 Tax=Vibrio rumoiensis TaxID=76258 RepID=UPI000B5CBA2C|nr:peptidylprolyl isomerase [Vibrio rumoiensis]
MMDRLREGVNGIAVKIILVLIILSFVFAGVSSYLVGGGSNAAAKVGNTTIERNAFEQAYQNERNRMQSQMGDYFSTLMGDQQYVQTFRKSVLDRMINDVLLEQYAQSLGLRVSDEQVSQLILTMPQFQTNGKFDQDIYAATLRRAGFSADSFAEYLRKDMLRNQVVSAVQNSEFTLDDEVTQQSQLLTQTRDIQTITLNVSDFSKKAQVTDEELQSYYKAHSENYERPEQMKVAYVELSAEQLKKSVKVTDEDAQAYYQDHLDKYSTKEQRKVRHILIKDDEAKAETLLATLKAGADFATVAKENSEDVGSAKQGGDLGWMEKGVMDPAFEEAAFALKAKGDISEVVKSDFGYHIIQLEDDKAAEAKPYSEVAADIKAELVDEKAVEQFYKLQTKLESVAFESPDSLDESAKVAGQKIQTTDFISQADAPEVLKVPAVAQALESSDVKQEGMNSEVLEVAPEHVIVVRVNDVREETVLPFEEVKAQVQAQLLATKGEQDALELASKVVASLKKGDESILASNQLSFADEQNIDRRSPLAQNVFALPHPQDGVATYGQTKDENGNIVIVKLNKVTSGSDAQFEQQIASQLLRMNNQQDLEVILNSLRKSTSIEYKAIEQP